MERLVLLLKPTVSQKLHIHHYLQLQTHRTRQPIHRLSSPPAGDYLFSAGSHHLAKERRMKISPRDEQSEREKHTA